MLKNGQAYFKNLVMFTLPSWKRIEKWEQFVQIFQDQVEKMQASFHYISISYETFYSYGHTLILSYK